MTADQPREDAIAALREAAEVTVGRFLDTTASLAGVHVAALNDLRDALDALAAAPKVESVRAASERLGIPIGHVRDYPHRFAPFEDDGLVQRGHVPCCWCGEHHEEGR